MTRYLVAAEADKIQDFVFRASHLREVTGGSSLLTRFCQEVPRGYLGCEDDDIVISDGGSFRLLFDTLTQAQEASQKLADYYYLTTGCTLSVAAPVEWDGDEKTFLKANKPASAGLRAAKRTPGASMTPHTPQMAFCASTGVELAADFKEPKKGRAATYLARSTLVKKREWGESKEEFILDFVRHVAPTDTDIDRYDFPTEASEVGRAGGYEPRDYVAYLVADGNGMGAIFDRCTSRSVLNKLSTNLSEIVRDTLATSAKLVMQNSTEQKGKYFVPILPLILGGDDVFVLLPAKWAVSFAQEFCRAFEQRMVDFLRQQPELADAPKPTMSAAIVICKSKYPFHLAHQRGKQLLKEAKGLSKSRPQQPMSVITFELIVGNRLVDHSRDTGNHRPTLRPYWVGGPPANSNPSVQQLLDARLSLNSLPQKRQAQLRAFFESPLLQTGGTERGKWRDDLETVANRIGKLSDDDRVAHTIKNALAALGNDRGAFYWRTLPTFSGNALPEVLDAWDFLYDLQQDQEKYKEAAA